jgi:hypothetical protein
MGVIQMNRAKAATLAIAVLSLAVASVPAKADLVIDVVPWLAPNFFGSPSFSGAEANAVQGMMNGGVATGSGPTAFIPQSNVTSAQAIVTPFNSWMGVAGPAAPYAAELGNRMTFAGSIIDTGGTFSISQLSFNATSSDPGNVLGFGFAAGSYNYGSGYVGVVNGPNGPTFITSGPSSQLVNELFFRGSGNSLAANQCPGCTVEQEQAQIAIAAAFFTSDTTFTGTYSIGDVSGSGTFDIAAAVPEPSTWAMMILGFLGLGFMAYRRKRTSTALSVA